MGWSPVVRGLGIAATGAVMVGAAIVALSCAYIGRWNITTVALLVSAAAGIAFKQWFRPFIDRLGVDSSPCPAKTPEFLRPSRLVLPHTLKFVQEREVAEHDFFTGAHLDSSTRVRAVTAVGGRA